MSANEGAAAAAAVAVDNSVLIYKNMKPYFKATLPNLPVGDGESAIWQQAQADPNISMEVMREVLTEVRDLFGALTARSHRFLAIPAELRPAFVSMHKDSPLVRSPTIVAMSTLYENAADTTSPQCLVVATEVGDIFVLSPKNFAVLHKVSGSAP